MGYGVQLICNLFACHCTRFVEDCIKAFNKKLPSMRTAILTEGKLFFDMALDIIKKSSRVGASIIEREQILQNLHSNARNHERNRIAKVRCLEISSKPFRYYFVSLHAFLTLLQCISSDLLNPNLHHHKSVLIKFHASYNPITHSLKALFATWLIRVRTAFSHFPLGYM